MTTFRDLLLVTNIYLDEACVLGNLYYLYLWNGIAAISPLASRREVCLSVTARVYPIHKLLNDQTCVIATTVTTVKYRFPLG